MPWRGILETGGISPLILSLSNRWTSAANFLIHAALPQEQEPPVPIEQADGDPRVGLDSLETIKVILILRQVVLPFGHLSF